MLWEFGSGRDGKPNGQNVLYRKSKDGLYMDGTAKAGSQGGTG
jgi:hypothetical protein